MSLQATLTGRKAYKAHGNGNYAEAMKLYEQAYDQGMDNPRWILGYTVLLLRDGQYAKGRQILVKLQKNPMLTPDQKTQLFVNYAAAVFHMDELDKGIGILERQHAHNPCGLIYQTLGYLYVEKYAPERAPDFDALEAQTRAGTEAAAEGRVSADADAEGETPADEPAAAAKPEAPARSARQEWQEGMEKAESFLKESIDYDDEDSICLDNMAQWLYRVKGDKDGARDWFDRAIKQKPNQIDTLWFLSRYDLDNGDRDAAVKKLETVLEGRFSPLNYVNRGMAEEELARLKG